MQALLMVPRCLFWLLMIKARECQYNPLLAASFERKLNIVQETKKGLCMPLGPYKAFKGLKGLIRAL